MALVLQGPAVEIPVETTQYFIFPSVLIAIAIMNAIAQRQGNAAHALPAFARRQCKHLRSVLGQLVIVKLLRAMYLLPASERVPCLELVT